MPTIASRPARASQQTSSRRRRSPTCGRSGTRSRARRSAKPRQPPPTRRQSPRPVPERRARAALVAAAEVDREGGAVLAVTREPVHGTDTGIAEAAVEDVGAVRRAVHPRLDDPRRGATTRGAATDDLAVEVAVGAGEVSAAPDPGLDRAAARRVVGEVVAAHHVTAVARGGAGQLR